MIYSLLEQFSKWRNISERRVCCAVIILCSLNMVARADFGNIMDNLVGFYRVSYQTCELQCVYANISETFRVWYMHEDGYSLFLFLFLFLSILHTIDWISRLNLGVPLPYKSFDRKLDNGWTFSEYSRTSSEFLSDLEISFVQGTVMYTLSLNELLRLMLLKENLKPVFSPKIPWKQICAKVTWVKSQSQVWLQ